MIPDDCKPCPEGGYCPGEQACGCHGESVRAMRAQLAEAKAQVDHVPTLQAEVVRLRGVIDRIGIGGNHLASALIGILGASDADFPPYTTPIEDIHLRIDDPNYRDLWICWAVMMRERDELRKEGV